MSLETGNIWSQLLVNVEDEQILPKYKQYGQG